MLMASLTSATISICLLRLLKLPHPFGLTAHFPRLVGRALLGTVTMASCFAAVKLIPLSDYTTLSFL